jgi:hypothetical protein
MITFGQHIILSPDAQFYISVLIVVLILLFLAIAFVGYMLYQLGADASERERAEARKAR